MTFTLPETITEQSLTAAVREWVRANLPAAWLDAVDRGDRAALRQQQNDPDVAAQWFAALGDVGLATPMWPKEYGGLELSAEQGGIITGTLMEYGAERPMSDFVGLYLAGGTILVHGTYDQKKQFLDPLRRAEHRWCQLFSEPGAGSDLAGLSTRAVRQEDGSWLVNGQKVWSSFAHISDFGLLMARTDQELPKHRGITYFLLDMRTPGVLARPLRQMTGNAEFNEVFFDDVVVPPDAVLGEVNGGWQVAITTLMQERNGLTGRPSVGRGRADGLLSRIDVRSADSTLLDRVMKHVVDERVLQMTTVRAYVESAGKEVGAEGSIRKLMSSALEEEFGTLSAELDPGRAIAWTEGDDEVSQDFLAMKTTSIAGGTSEIQRNIIGERVLGLPKDHDPDRDVPFKKRGRA